MNYQKPKLTADLLYKDMGEEGILLNPNTSAYYRVNPLGVKMINLILNPALDSFDEEVKKVVQQCVDEAGVSEEQVHQDINAFFKDLKDAEITES